MVLDSAALERKPVDEAWQAKALVFVIVYTKRHGKAPTWRELALYMGWKPHTCKTSFRMRKLADSRPSTNHASGAFVVSSRQERTQSVAWRSLMPRAAKACPHPTCPNLQGQCDEHDRKPWQGSLRRSRTVSGGRQQKRRKHVLHRDNLTCHRCGEIKREADLVSDHVIPLAVDARLSEHRHLPLSLVDHVSNQAPCCLKCHADKTAEESKRARGL